MSLYDLDSNLLYMKSCFSKKRGFMYCLGLLVYCHVSHEPVAIRASDESSVVVCHLQREDSTTFIVVYSLFGLVNMITNQCHINSFLVLECQW